MRHGRIALALLAVCALVAILPGGWACNNPDNLPQTISSLPYVGAVSSTDGAPKVEVPCDSVAVASVGHWYRYDVPSTVDQTVYATTCTEFTAIDTILQLYESWTSECILTDPYYMPNCTIQMDGTPTDTNGLCSTLAFTPTAAKTYWFYVFGYAGSTGTYSLNVSITPPAQCAAGATDVPNPSLSTPWIKTNINSDTTGVTIYSKCSKLPDSQKGNWFVYTGDGNYITISICPNSGYDTKFTVFTPTTCNNCYCAQCGPVYDDPVQTSNCDSTTFLTVLDKPYYIFATAVQVGTTAIYSATFTRSLAASPTVPTPADSLCLVVAPQLRIDSPVIGWLIPKNNGVSSTACGTTTSTSGTWYSVTGYSGEMFLSTCGYETQFDTKLSIFYAPSGCNSCSCLQCVSSSEASDVAYDSSYSQFCVKSPGVSTLSIIRFPNMQSDVRYYAFVYARFYPPESDVFSLHLVDKATKVSPPDSSCLPTAKPLVLGEPAIAYLSSVAGIENSNCYVSTFTKGAWYSITGYSGEMFLSTCGPYTQFETKLDVFVFPSSCVNCTCSQCLTRTTYQTSASEVVNVSNDPEYAQYCVRNKQVTILRFINMKPTDKYYVFVSSQSSYTYPDKFSLVMVNDRAQITSSAQTINIWSVLLNAASFVILCIIIV